MKSAISCYDSHAKELAVQYESLSPDRLWICMGRRDSAVVKASLVVEQCGISTNDVGRDRHRSSTDDMRRA